MDPTHDISKIATCTTCQFKENKSNYWTANGSFTRVPQMPNFGTGTPNGGMTVYYVQNEPKITAFPRGFRMITGNPMLRTKDTKHPPRSPVSDASEPTGKTVTTANRPAVERTRSISPTGPCAGGIRSNTNFPQCWDGSHIVHPEAPIDPATGLTFYRGKCPPSHPVRMPLLIFETIWDTRQFNDMWPTDGTQPFVYSMGDPTGYGHHGDYMAMDTCTEFNGVPSYCKALTVQPDSEINKCTLKPVLEEQIDGSE
ncbi:hypothetical protein BKA70DRAFT_1372972 [Coprinopsis sp. MPI-PUGE-AT-0042]|nr:hypothetical protein BKA70DRAFT_1372972 [Coprinopsis sp. MPI-PUGE-AT-0042]